MNWKPIASQLSILFLLPELEGPLVEEATKKEVVGGMTRNILTHWLDPESLRGDATVVIHTKKVRLAAIPFICTHYTSNTVFFRNS